jgi:gliding motility-associated-like protein
MKNTLEQLYKNKFENFQAQPSDKIWNNIEKQMRLKSIRKILFISSVFAIAGILLFTFLSDKNKNKNKLLAAQNIEYHINKIRIASVSNSLNYNQNFAELKNQNIKKNTTQNTSKSLIYVVATKKVDNDTSDNQLIVDNKIRQKNDTKEDTKGFDISSKIGCQPLTVVLQNNKQSKWQKWSINGKNYSNRKNIQIRLNKTGNYNITLERSDSEGKIKYYEDSIRVVPKPKADFSVPDKIEIDKQIMFENNSKNIKQSQWIVDGQRISDNYNAFYEFEQRGKHTIKLVVINDNGCSDTATKQVNVLQPKEYIVFPTAFTPDKIGPSSGYYKSGIVNANKVFHPYLFSKTIVKYNLRIYNRTGKLIFESNDVNIGWDGYYRNNLVPIDVYVYVAKGQFSDGTRFVKQGNVTVIY